MPNAKRRLRLTGAEEAEYTATQLTIDENNTVANQINVAQKLRKRLPNARITSYTPVLRSVQRMNVLGSAKALPLSG